MPYELATPEDIALALEDAKRYADESPGTPGPEGPTGPQGEQGIQGEPGPAGPAGETGTAGPTGEQGIQGETGAEGPAGAVGAAGVDGTDGVDGAPGAEGPQGDPGPQGEAGPEGPAGPKGATGPAGIDGATGPAGPIGPVGPAGQDGTGVSTFLDVTAKFGGDYRLAVTEAERSGGPSALVWLGGKSYPVLGPCVVSNSITIAGAGRGATRFVHNGSYRGPVFQINQAKRNGQLESTANGGPITTYDPTVDKGHTEFRDFSIYSPKREDGVIREGLYFMSLDDARLSNVRLENLTGTALKLGADESDKGITSPASGRVRESNFNEVDIYRCGSGSPNGSPDIPAMIIQGADGAGDGSNQLFFSQLRFVYNEGRMVISGRSETDSLRRVHFSQTQLHALADNANWSPSKWFPFDFVTLEGSVREVIFNGVYINGTASGTAGFVLKGHPLTGQTPKRLTLRDVNVVNIGGDLVRVEKGDVVSVDGTSLGAVGGRVINNVAGSGLARFYINELGINSPAGKSAGLTGVGGGAFHTGQSVTA